MEIKVNINTRAIAMGIVRSLAHNLHQQVTDQAVVRFGNVAGQPLSQFFSFGLGQVMPSMQPPLGMHPFQHPAFYAAQRPYGAPGPHGHQYGFDANVGFTGHPVVKEDGMCNQPTEETVTRAAEEELQHQQNTASNPNEPPKNQYTYEQMLDQFCNDPQVIGAVERVLVKQLETYAQLAAQEPTPMPAFRPAYNRGF